MASESTTLYLKADRNVEVSKQNVMLGDLLNMECSDKTILMKVKTLRILKIREEKRTALCNFRVENHCLYS